jgi:hypothetical protein
MSFNSGDFVIAGTVIAIFGVGLYIWDTRKEAVVNTYNQYTQPTSGGTHSRRHKSRHNKTKRHKESTASTHSTTK